MTYCVAIKVEKGLVALADSRITAGTLVTSARKVTLFDSGNGHFFVMTSGLRSLRDKTIAYFEKVNKTKKKNFDSMLEALSAYTSCVREVAKEDREFLEQSDMKFNLHSIIGGCIGEDASPRLYLVYPEGNWVEIEESTPYTIIGAQGYGKPILDRALTYESTLRAALKVAYFSFDATLFSSSDVGFPITLLVYEAATGLWQERVLAEEDIRELRSWWNERMKDLVSQSPNPAWLDTLSLPPHRNRVPA